MTGLRCATDVVPNVAHAAALLGARIEAASVAIGPPVALDWAAMASQRATLEGLDPTPSATSAGGATRIERCADGWVAVSLARPDDDDLLPAWLALAGAATVADASGAALADAAALVGLPVGILGERRGDLAPTTSLRFGSRPVRWPVQVLDLSALWAGPLCAHLLGLAGAQVTKVESLARPDASRHGNPALFASLNGAKEQVALDLSTAAGRAQLAALVRRADVVVESSRPRALEQLGVVAARELAHPDGPSVWVSITGHGRSSPRVAFGDDAAVAGGLVAWSRAGEPQFAGDALADPLAGLAAAATALEHLAAGERALVDAPLAGAAAWAASPSNLVPKTPHAGDFGTKFERDRPELDAPLVITDAEVDGRRVDVRIEGGRIVAVDRTLARLGVATIDAGGAALIPGLHDHHLHLLAMAAARQSLDVASLRTPAAFDRAVRAAHQELAPERWLRVVGVHDAHGEVGSRRLDALAPGRRIRAQHRSGAAWVLSPAGFASIGGAGGGAAEDWIHRDDAALGRRWAEAGDDALDLGAVAVGLAAAGVTGATDATPYDDAAAWAVLASARGDGTLPQRVVAMGGPPLATSAAPAGLVLGPVKVLVGDHDLPSIDVLARWFRQAHDAGRPVAVHCVTRVALVVALAAWEEAGALPGDRIEHGSVVPAELVGTIAALGLTVVTQPAFLRARGDHYLAEVEPDDLPHLYRCGTLLAAGVRMGLSTDAPFGPADPWLAIAAAADRRTVSGAAVGPREAISPAVALDRFLSGPDDPGGAPRRVEVGAAADLVLLDRPLASALVGPGAHVVRTTWIGGRLVHDQGGVEHGGARHG